MINASISLFPRAFVLCAALFTVSLTSAQALDKVTVTVQVKTEGASMDSGRSRSETQARSLEINVANRTREELAGLDVKWTFFGFDLKDDETVSVDSGTEKTTLGQARSAVIKSKTVSFNYTPAGMKGGGKVKGKEKTKARKAEATGTRYAGWAVQVFQNGTLVGEAYSRADLKDDL